MHQEISIGEPFFNGNLNIEDLDEMTGRDRLELGDLEFPGGQKARMTISHLDERR